MSIQWTLVAGVMYAELAFTVFLLMPFVSPQRWNKFFKSSFLRSIRNMGHFYFKIFLAVLVLFFLDAIREMRKYSNELDERQNADHAHHHLDADMQAQLRLFRAQRNFYITGFSLVLWGVLQRLATLISRLAVALAEKEAAMRQAESASTAASQLMDKKKVKADSDENTDQKEANTNNEMKELREENRRLEAEYKAALKQATSVTQEYDRLLEEHSKLQEDIKQLTSEEGSKKED